MLNRLLYISGLVLFISACSNGGGGSDVQKGAFLDSAVFGLRFETETKSGVTNSDGKFTYLPGETVKFYIGNILLGSAIAKATMTPVDLVPGATDEKNPQVTNLARLLQTLDADGNPNNGIEISSEVMAQAASQTINFGLTTSDFETNTDILTVISFLTQGFPGGSKTLVSIADAQAHLNTTLIGIASTDTGAPPSTGSFGTLTITGTDTSNFGSSYNPTIAQPSLSAQIDLVTWLITGAGGVLNATKAKANNGVGDTVTLVMPVSGSITETYTYSLSCIVDLTECQKFTIDTTTKTVDFNNITLTVVPSSSAVTNIATAPITLNGSLTW